MTTQVPTKPKEKTSTNGKPKENGTVTAVQALAAQGVPACVAALAKARATFNALGQGWRPTTPEGVAARAAVRVARKALTAATKAANVRAAYTAANAPQTYRTRAPKEAAKK